MTITDTFDDHWKPEPGPLDTPCHVWQRGRNPDQYGKVSVGGRTIGAHRFSYSRSVGPIPSGKWVLHRCDNPPCVNPEHLYLGSPRQNCIDRERRGRIKHVNGENHGRAKLSISDITRIHRLAREGLSNISIAARFGVSNQHVSDIRTGKKWKHLQPEITQ